ncbi:Uncharacterized protein APZ42_018459 [Daphnia magna]|uniref:Uncharacterized protein n=1 Tax=Daphnia magna TaxID=35525 RepID=A0A0P5BE24_9CRUS|nr:Uncharacterized protein APZ42_018459 [Daphnia magna]
MAIIHRLIFFFFFLQICVSVKQNDLKVSCLMRTFHVFHSINACLQIKGKQTPHPLPSKSCSSALHTHTLREVCRCHRKKVAHSS